MKFETVRIHFLESDQLYLRPALWYPRWTVTLSLLWKALVIITNFNDALIRKVMSNTKRLTNKETLTVCALFCLLTKL